MERGAVESADSSLTSRPSFAGQADLAAASVWCRSSGRCGLTTPVGRAVLSKLAVADLRPGQPDRRLDTAGNLWVEQANRASDAGAASPASARTLGARFPLLESLRRAELGQSGSPESLLTGCSSDVIRVAWTLTGVVASATGVLRTVWMGPLAGAGAPGSTSFAHDRA